MANVEIFGFAGSTYVRAALMTCLEKGVGYALVPLDFGSDSHGALHPFRKIPALRHDDLVLFETAAIITYVDAIGSGPDLQPDDAVKRALMWQWDSAAIDYGYDPLVRAELDDERPDKTDAAARNRILEALEHGLAERPYQAGSALSLADIMVMPMIAFNIASRSSDAKDALSQWPKLSAWYARMAERDSFKETAG